MGMFDPLRHWGFLGESKGKTVGIVGIGGLGTMGIKIAKAQGHNVMAISTSNKKKELATTKGADYFVVSKDPESIKANAGMCDIILNTAASNHDLNVYLPLLAKNGVIVQLGLLTEPHPICQLPLLSSRLSIAESLFGGIQSTQECIDFCFKHGVYPDCQTVEAKDIDECWEKLKGSGNADGVRYVTSRKAWRTRIFCLEEFFTVRDLLISADNQSQITTHTYNTSIYPM